MRDVVSASCSLKRKAILNCSVPLDFVSSDVGSRSLRREIFRFVISILFIFPSVFSHLCLLVFLGRVIGCYRFLMLSLQ